jgi:predicted nucleic acid-binding protein
VLFKSDVTFAEIRFGIERIVDPARRADLVHWLDRTLRPLFAGRVLSVTEDALLRSRLRLEAGRATGHTFLEPVLLVAALAALAEHIVVSRDTSEFVAAAVPVFDPWDWTLYAGDRVLKLGDADGSDALASATALLSI